MKEIVQVFLNDNCSTLPAGQLWTSGGPKAHPRDRSNGTLSRCAVKEPTLWAGLIFESIWAWVCLNSAWFNASCSIFGSWCQPKCRMEEIGSLGMQSPTSCAGVLFRWDFSLELTPNQLMDWTWVMSWDLQVAGALAADNERKIMKHWCLPPGIWGRSQSMRLTRRDWKGVFLILLIGDSQLFLKSQT